MSRPFAQRVFSGRQSLTAMVAPRCACGHSRGEHYSLGSAPPSACLHVFHGREYCPCPRYREAADGKEVG